MPDIRQTPISQLPALTEAVSSSSPVVVVQGGVTYRTTVGDIIALAGGGGIEEAPTDGLLYGRSLEGWYPVPVSADPPFVVEDYPGQARTLVAADQDKLIRCTSAIAVTLTVGAGLPANWKCDVLQAGGGQVTIAGAAGVTVNASDAKKKTRLQYSVLGIAMTALNTVVVYGDRS